MALIDEVKIYLDITWSDPHTDDKVTGIIARAKAKICDYAGIAAGQLDLSEESAEKQLFLDLCRYIYNNASEDFEDNYRADLIMLRANHRTEAMTGEDETQDSAAGG